MLKNNFGCAWDYTTLMSEDWEDKINNNAVYRQMDYGWCNESLMCNDDMRAGEHDGAASIIRLSVIPEGESA